MTSAAPQQNGQDLCLSCGLCCNGTIFRSVPIDNEEAILRHKAAGVAFDIRDRADGAREFMLPCPAYRDKCCNIYSDRPGACRNYKCRLLTAYTDGKIGLRVALEIVEKGKHKRDEILRRVPELGVQLKSGNIPFDLYEEVLALCRKLEPGELKRKCDELLLQIAALRFFVSANFQKLGSSEEASKSEQ